MAPNERSFIDRFIEQALARIEQLDGRVSALETSGAVAQRDAEVARAEVTALRGIVESLSAWQIESRPVLDRLEGVRSRSEENRRALLMTALKEGLKVVVAAGAGALVAWFAARGGA